MAVNVGQRNVSDTPANQQLEAIDLALELVLHTLKITRNKNIFTDEYKDLTGDIIQCAKDIYIYAWDANGEYVRADHKDRWPERNRKQLKAISRCNRLFALTNVARRAFHLRGKKVRYWQGMISDTRKALSKWHESNRRQYGM